MTAQILQVTIDDCNGINEVKDNSVRVYPNPASGFVHVTNLKAATIRIYNLLGVEEMTVYHASGLCTIDVSLFDNGIYFVKVEQNDGYVVFQLVKE